MKKYIYWVGLLALMLTSCADTPQEKAEALIEKYVKNCLFIPESYESVSTSVDSAYAPLCDPNFHETFTKLTKLDNRVDELTEEIASEEYELSSALSNMAIYDNGYTSYRKHKYTTALKAKEEHEMKLKELTERKDRLVAKGRKMYEDLLSRMDEEPRFIGYLCMHRCRAENRTGQKLLSDYFFVCDPKLTRILLVYDMEDESFKKFDEFVQDYQENKDME